MGQRQRPMYYTADLLHDGTVLWAFPIRKPSKQELKLCRTRIDADGLARFWASSGRDLSDVQNETRTRFQDIIANRLNTRRAIRQLVLPALAAVLEEVQGVRTQLYRIEVMLKHERSGGLPTDCVDGPKQSDLHSSTR